MADTMLPAGNGLPELTFNLAPAVLAGAPFFIGRTADQLAAECESHAEPNYVDALLVAGLVGGGIDHKTARGYVHRMRHSPNAGMDDFATHGGGQRAGVRRRRGGIQRPPSTGGAVGGTGLALTAPPLIEAGTDSTSPCKGRKNAPDLGVLGAGCAELHPESKFSEIS